MTWSEFLKQERMITPWNVQREWIAVAKAFGNEYNVVIRLKGSSTRCGEMLTIEMYHPNDPKNIVRYKINDGLYVGSRRSPSRYFEYLYEKLPIVRRKKFIKEQELQRRQEQIQEDFN